MRPDSICSQLQSISLRASLSSDVTGITGPHIGQAACCCGVKGGGKKIQCLLPNPVATLIFSFIPTILVSASPTLIIVTHHLHHITILIIVNFLSTVTIVTVIVSFISATVITMVITTHFIFITITTTAAFGVDCIS